MRRADLVLVACLLCLVMASPARAAGSLDVGGLASLDRSDGGIRALAGLRFSGLRPGAAGSDLGISAFAGNGTGTHLGVVGVILDLGAVYSVPLEGSGLLVPRVGLSALATAGEGGGGTDLGVVLGVGAVLLPDQGVGARVDANLRWLPSPSELVLGVTVGPTWGGQPR